jgi:hypothetical protein
MVRETVGERVRLDHEDAIGALQRGDRWRELVA